MKTKNQQILEQMDRIRNRDLSARNHAILKKMVRLANQTAKRSSLDVLI